MACRLRGFTLEVGELAWSRVWSDFLISWVLAWPPACTPRRCRAARYSVRAPPLLRVRPGAVGRPSVWARALCGQIVKITILFFDYYGKIR